ncbi:hypothetical protein GCM10025777_01720 [Membranihabitans marinus]
MDTAASYAQTMSPSIQSDLSHNATIVKEGSIVFKTKDIEETGSFIRNKIDTLEIILVSDQQYSTEHSIRNDLVVQVPIQFLDSFMDNILHHAHSVVHKQIISKDVGEEKGNSEIYLKSQKELEEKFIHLLEKTKNIGEIIELENQLNIVRQKIYELEYSAQNLKQRISYASLTISYHQDIPLAKRFGNKIKSGVYTVWNNLMLFVIFVVNLWPFFVLFTIFYYWYWRRRKIKIAKAKNQDQIIKK